MFHNVDYAANYLAGYLKSRHAHRFASMTPRTCGRSGRRATFDYLHATTAYVQRWAAFWHREPSSVPRPFACERLVWVVGPAVESFRVSPIGGHSFLGPDFDDRRLGATHGSPGGEPRLGKPH